MTTTQTERSITLPDIVSRKEWRRQRIVYHFMWLWDGGGPRDDGCPSCSAGADEISDGLLEHLRSKEEWAGRDLPLEKWEQPFDLHGQSCFLRDGGRVFHTYSM